MYHATPIGVYKFTDGQPSNVTPVSKSEEGCAGPNGAHVSAEAAA